MMQMAAEFSQDETFAAFLFDSSADGIVVLDEAGSVLRANRAAEELGWREIEPLVTAANTPDAELAEFRRQIRARGRGETEVRFANPAGEIRYLHLEARTYAESHVLVLRDVTHRRTMEAELREARRLESLGHFTASLAHDFNNLLTPIACIGAMLEEKLSEGSPAGRLASELNVLVENGAMLVRQVLAFTRGESAVVEATNISTVVADLRVLVDRLVSKQVVVSASLDPDIGETMVDRVALEHAVLNLVANARDAMPNGGHLIFRTANVLLGYDEAEGPSLAVPRGAYVMLSVTDDGEGMAEEVRTRALERHFTTKPVGKGNGLGLANAQRFVSEHGGAIVVRSERGEGTAVTMYLPRIDGARITPTIAPPKPSR